MTQTMGLKRLNMAFQLGLPDLTWKLLGKKSALRK